MAAPSQHDIHSRLTVQEAQARGCTCEFGCRSCGYSLAQMGNCPAWDPCPVGRAPNATCPLNGM